MCGDGYESVCYVKPCIAEVEPHYEIVKQETFAPILYLLKFKDIAEAILREVEQFLSQVGSDWALPMEILVAPVRRLAKPLAEKKKPVADEKAEAIPGKAYMRRQTNTINYSTGLPLAQGIKFHVEI